MSDTYTRALETAGQWRRSIPDERRPSQRSRVLAALAIAVLSALLFYFERLREPGSHSDFSQAWFGARALIQGANPYDLIGPGRTFEWLWPLFYPATTLLVALPFAWLSELLASTLFVAVSAALLAYAVTADGWYRLPIFLSSAFVIAVRASQWSPLMTAALCLPAAAWLLAAKPNLGLTLIAYTRSTTAIKVAVIGGAVLLLASIALLPRWPAYWIANVRSVDQFTIPITRGGGIFVLLALLRWRRPEARLIVALACVPQTVYWYEALPLLLVPATFRESLILSLTSSCGFLLERQLVGFQANVPFRDVGTLMIAFVYLPATLMVLLRPNTGERPDWLRRATLSRKINGGAVPSSGVMT